MLTEQETIELKRLVPALAEKMVFINGQPLVLERPWQYGLVGSTNMFEVWAKSRQIGFSWGDALRSMCRAMLFPPGTYNKVFISINEEEAKEKVRYIDFFLENIPRRYMMATPVRNLMEIEFANGNRIESFPSKALRGKPNVDLSLDEFAHIQNPDIIYEGSRPATIRGSYGITVGSTPFGRGLFMEMFQTAGLPGRFRSFVPKMVPWWHSKVLCLDVNAAIQFAPYMRTEERVEEFGTERLKEEFVSYTLEIFQQEYEASFISSGNSVLSEELIMSRTDGTMNMEHRLIDLDCSNPNIDISENIKILVDHVKALGYIEIFGGYDVGRENNASEIILLGRRNDDTVTIGFITLRRCPFPDQRDALYYLMDKLPIKKMVIDHNGIGMQIADEAVYKYSTRVFPMDFSMQSKEAMVTSLVKAFEDKTLTIYAFRRFLLQLMSVKKEFSESSRILYRSAQTKDGKDGKSHADLFWALAMAQWGAYDYMKGHVIITNKSPRLQKPNASGGFHFGSGKRF